MTRIHGHHAPRLSRAAVFALGMALSAPGAFALPQSVAPPAESAQAPKVAVTAEDHLAKAAEYRKKAASYRVGGRVNFAGSSASRSSSSRKSVQSRIASARDGTPVSFRLWRFRPSVPGTKQ